MLRPVFASFIALALPLASAQAQEAAPAEPLALDKLADPAITKAIEQGEIEVASTGEIIVQGTTEKDIRNFVWRGVTEMTGGKIAVRDETLCLSFDSIDETLEAALRERIAANLATVGRTLEEPGCHPNAFVAFPSDAHAYMGWLNDNRRYYFDSMYEPERRRHVRPRRVAYNWHYVPDKAIMRGMQRGGAGFNPSGSADFAYGVGYGRYLLGSQWNRMGFNDRGSEYLQSIISPLVAQLETIRISHSFTVIEAGAVEGLSSTQLADYITMHALVMFEPGVPKEVPPGSILRLFDERGANPAAAEEMSAVDRVVLSTLYREGHSRFNAGLIRNEITRTAKRGGK
jgi:hypothetical protein